MSDSPATAATKTPWHLWVTGVLALLWNCMGAVDYTMTETRNAAYLSAMTPEQLAYLSAFPLWAVASWAFGVWGGVLGSILLLMRKRWAFPIFAISAIAVVLTHLYNFVLSDGLAIMGGGIGSLIFAAVIFVVAAALLLYAQHLVRAGVLR